MHTCDVLIVGGGPAGSSCAWALRDSGLDVVILDKAVFPRDKVCGGWITPRVLERLNIDAADYARGRVLQPITGFRVSRMGAAHVEVGYGEPVSYGIRRREFDDYLLRRCGARLIEGVALSGLEASGDGWIANGDIRARVVVGAGGHFCPVARLTGAKGRDEAAVVAQEIEFEMSADQRAHCRIGEETPELFFCPDMLGYGWCFRKGDLLNIGLGRADPHRLLAHVSEFLGLLKATGRISFEVPPLHGHAYLLYGATSRSPVGDRLVLIGDATGLAYAQSGEGILPAIESGLLAGGVIAGANGDYSRKNLERYRTALVECFGAPQLLGKIAARLPAQTISAAARILLGSKWLTREVVLNRWFLHAA